MQANIVLTVSESKRLIAEAVVQLPVVQHALEKGWVVVCTGTTTAYVAEEILGDAMFKPSFITGHTTPATIDSGTVIPGPRQTDLVLYKGERVDKTKFEAVKEFGEGDVLIKSANALNYAQGVAGVLIGDPNGGTVGGCLGPVIGRRGTLVVPCGLEKEVAHDIMETHRRANAGDDRLNAVPRLWPVTGEIVTEIEALELLAGCEVIHLASGGILGAEGGVRLLLMGDDEGVEAGVRLCESVQGEPSFEEQCRQGAGEP